MRNNLNFRPPLTDPPEQPPNVAKMCLACDRSGWAFGHGASAKLRVGLFQWMKASIREVRVRPVTLSGAGLPVRMNPQAYLLLRRNAFSCAAQTLCPLKSGTSSSPVGSRDRDPFGRNGTMPVFQDCRGGPNADGNPEGHRVRPDRALLAPACLIWTPIGLRRA